MKTRKELKTENFEEIIQKLYKRINKYKKMQLKCMQEFSEFGNEIYRERWFEFDNLIEYTKELIDYLEKQKEKLK